MLEKQTPRCGNGATQHGKNPRKGEAVHIIGVARNEFTLILRQRYLDLLGDPLAALLLNQIVYLTGRYHDLDRFPAEEEARQEGPLPYGAPVFGWISRSDVQSARETMIGSRSTVQRLMRRLEREGYVLSEASPGSTRRFRLQLVELLEALRWCGWPAYVIERKPVQDEQPVQDAQPAHFEQVVQGGRTPAQNEQPPAQFEQVPPILSTIENGPWEPRNSFRGGNGPTPPSS